MLKTPVRDTLFYGDNLAILREHIEDESVDLVYLDPPFQSGRDYNILFEEQDGKRAAYMKVTTGSADDWPALGVAVAIEGDGTSVKSVRVVASAATSKAMRLISAEKLLTGQRIDDKLLTRAGEAAAEEAEIIADVRGSVSYKRELLRVYVGRAVRATIGDGAH